VRQADTRGSSLQHQSGRLTLSHTPRSGPTRAPGCGHNDALEGGSQDGRGPAPPARGGRSNEKGLSALARSQLVTRGYFRSVPVQSAVQLADGGMLRESLGRQLPRGARTASEIGRSKPEPSLRRAAGAGFTVIRRFSGHSSEAETIPLRTRSCSPLYSLERPRGLSGAPGRAWPRRGRWGHPRELRSGYGAPHRVPSES
jgi:hypothetical protein